MPGISNRRQGELLRAVFQILLENPDGLPAREVLEKMRVLVPFNEYESGHYFGSPNEPRAMTEPSNVRAGGGACPFRFRCAGCDHFRTDISYLPDLHLRFGKGKAHGGLRLTCRRLHHLDRDTNGPGPC